VRHERLKARRSALRWGGCNRYLARLRLLTESGWALWLVAFAGGGPFLSACGRFALIRAPVRVVTALLLLLRRLVHGVEDTEVVLCVLEEAFRLHPIPAAGRVAPELQIFFEQLLRGSADAYIGPVAVEDMVTVQRNAAGLVTDAATTTATTARPVVTTTHTFHVHANDVVLSHCRLARGAGGHSPGIPERIRVVGH
jgi:hypothetical protein